MKRKAGRSTEKEARCERRGDTKREGRGKGRGGKDELVEREGLSGSNVSEFPSDRISGSFLGFFSLFLSPSQLRAILVGSLFTL